MVTFEAQDMYREWEEVFAAILKAPGATLILGGTDVGKTTFTRLLANKLLAAGESIAVLDADLGQSEIGPPACVGLAFPLQPFAALSDLAPHALAFVGRTSPVGSLLEYAASITRLAQMASGRHLIIDTSGYQRGVSARTLYHTLVDLLQPAHIVALQRGVELAPTLAPLKYRNVTLHTPSTPVAIAQKPPQLRKIRRAMKFATYFQNVEQHIYSFDEVGLFGTWLGGGSPVPAHILAFINQTFGRNYRVYYAETHGQDLGLMLQRPLPSEFSPLGIVLQHLKVKAVTLTIAPQLKHLLLGLEGGDGKLLGLGLLETLDFRRRQFGVLTPMRSPSVARAVRFGSLRLLADGTDLGVLPPYAQ